jgi:hypothetical protein
MIAVPVPLPRPAGAQPLPPRPLRELLEEIEATACTLLALQRGAAHRLGELHARGLAGAGGLASLLGDVAGQTDDGVHTMRSIVRRYEQLELAAVQP